MKPTAIISINNLKIGVESPYNGMGKYFLKLLWVILLRTVGVYKAIIEISNQTGFSTEKLLKDCWTIFHEKPKNCMLII